MSEVNLNRHKGAANCYDKDVADEKRPLYFIVMEM